MRLLSAHNISGFLWMKRRRKYGLYRRNTVLRFHPLGKLRTELEKPSITFQLSLNTYS